MTNQSNPEKTKVPFNWMAFLFPAPYYAGHGKRKKAALLIAAGFMPLTHLFCMGYAGRAANRDIPDKGKFQWPYAIIALVAHMALWTVLQNVLNGGSYE